MLKNSTVTATIYGIDLQNVSNSTVMENTLVTPSEGVNMVAGDHILFEKNILSVHNNGFKLYDSSDNIFVGNTINWNPTGGGFVRYGFSLRNSHRNTASENTVHLYQNAGLISSNDNTFFKNNFLATRGNQPVIVDSASTGNRFSLPLPDGGNYWSANTACIDSDSDGFCDSPYYGLDTLPYAKENGWEAHAPR